MNTKIPSTVPVMVLSDCTLFPHAILPLYIFEQRYREMLKFALETDRMFCIGCRKPGSLDENPEVYPESTVGMIRACVGHDDGTSHLVLQGLHRVKFVDWNHDRSFRQAKLEPIRSNTSSYEDATGLADRVLRITKEISEASEFQVSDVLQSRLNELTEPEMIADIIGASFVGVSQIRQELLQMTEVESRLELIFSHLKQVLEHSKSNG